MSTLDQERLLVSLASVRAQALDCCRQLATLRESLLHELRTKASSLEVSGSLVNHYTLVLKLYGLVWAGIQRLLPQIDSWLLEPASASSRTPELLRTRLDVRLEEEASELKAEAARILAERGWSDADLETQVEEHYRTVRTIFEAFTETLQALQMDERCAGQQMHSLVPDETDRTWSVAQVLPTLHALDFGDSAQGAT
jgi:hypothetical protein